RRSQRNGGKSGKQPEKRNGLRHTGAKIHSPNLNPDLVKFSTVGKMIPRQFWFHALSQRPMGRHDSVWSQITRSVAVIGIASSNPMPPHTHPQKSSEIVMATAFSRTRRPTSCGATKFNAST